MSVRENVRAFLLGATPAELEVELKISVERGEAERAAAIRELIAEEQIPGQWRTHDAWTGAGLDLDVEDPASLPKVLRAAADAFYASQAELAAAWQDRGAGRVWGELAKVLERAAVQAEKAVHKYA